MSADIMLRHPHPPADAPMTPLADPSPEASADIWMAPLIRPMLSGVKTQVRVPVIL